MPFSPQQLAADALNRAQASTVSIEGRVTAYWTYPAAKETAETLILVHGYRGNHHGLEAIAGALPQYNLVIPDLPGFGLSEPFEGKHSVAAYTHWLQEFVATVAPNAKAVLGHSFGSIIVASSAASWLGKPIILVNPVATFKTSGVRAALEGSVGLFYWLGGNLPEQIGTAALKLPAMVRAMSEVLTKTRNPGLRGWIHKQHAENFSSFALRRVATEAYLASTGKNVTGYARNIHQPTLLLIGELDDITSVADQKRNKKLFESATLKQIDGVGHLIHYETPKLAADYITEFVSRLESK